MLWGMPRKPPRPRKTDDPEQHKRFIDTARAVEVDESGGAFDRAFDKVIMPPQRAVKEKLPPERAAISRKRPKG